MDIPSLYVVKVGIVGVQHFAPGVPDVTQRAVADGHVDAAPGVANGGTAHQTVCGLQTDGAHATVAQLLGDFGQHLDVGAFDADGELNVVVQFGQ